MFYARKMEVIWDSANSDLPRITQKLMANQPNLMIWGVNCGSFGTKHGSPAVNFRECNKYQQIPVTPMLKSPSSMMENPPQRIPPMVKYCRFKEPWSKSLKQHL